MFLIFGSESKLYKSKLGTNKTDNIVEYHVQATGARDYDGLVSSLSSGEGDLIGVLNTSQVYSMDRYVALLKEFEDSDYVLDDRVLLFLDEFMELVDRHDINVKIAICDYGNNALGHNALKLRNSVVKLLKGEVLDFNKKITKSTKKATGVEKVKDIE